MREIKILAGIYSENTKSIYKLLTSWMYEFIFIFQF